MNSHLFFPCEISQIEDLEFSEVDQDAERMRIFAAIVWLRFRDLAVFVFLTASGKRMVDDIAVTADHCDLHSDDRDNVAGMSGDVLVFSCGENLLIGVLNVERCSAGLGVDVCTMINECSDRNSIDQLWNAARMVVVIVGQQDIVDLADACEFCRRHDPVRIAASILWPTGVDE